MKVASFNHAYLQRFPGIENWKFGKAGYYRNDLNCRIELVNEDGFVLAWITFMAIYQGGPLAVRRWLDHLVIRGWNGDAA